MKRILLSIATVFVLLTLGSISTYAATSIAEEESNDTFSEAQEINRNNIIKSTVITGKYEGQNAVHGSISSTSDVDFYKVYLPVDTNTIFSMNSSRLSQIARIEIYDESLNLIKAFTHNQDTSIRGATPYRLTINKAGNYYVKIYSTIISGDYIFTIGGPNYSVDNYTYNSYSKLTLTPSIKSAQMSFNLSNVSTIPDGAVVYNVTFNGTKTNYASYEKRSLKLGSDTTWINTASYTFNADIPIASNKLLKSVWNAKIEGTVSSSTKPYSLTPSIRFSYLYPILP